MNTALTNLVRVGVVEDTAKFRMGLVAALERAEGLHCVAVCQSAADAMTQLPACHPDVVLLDLELGAGRSGLDILPELVLKLPETRFLVLTVVDKPEAIFQAFSRGAFGFLRKSISLGELPSAILDVHQGYPRLSPEVLRLVVDAFKNPAPATVELEKLSPREAEVLDLLAQGWERKELAARFNLSSETVKTHIKSIHKKLLVSTTQQAIRKVYPGKRLRLLPRWICGGDPLP